MPAFRRPAVLAMALALTLSAVWPVRAWAAPAAPRAPHARAFVLLDPATGRVLLSRGADRRLPVASLVKLMTARLALEADHPRMLVTVPAAAAALPQTKAGLIPGQKVALADLTAALLIRSANDAALTIAVGLAGSEPAFVARMNAQARSLGLANTHYENPSGLDAPGQWSSALDVARLAALDMRVPAFARLVVQPSVQIPGGAVYRNVDDFLRQDAAATGVKTGFTSEAMFCVAGSAERGGRTLIAVVLGEPDGPQADADVAALLHWGFGHLPPSAPRPSLPAPATAASR